MKQLFFTIMALLSFTIIKAQGLEDVILEKYYVMDAADAAATGMPVGTVTYRVFADLASGWELQSIYGSGADVFSVSSDMPFFNHEEASSFQQGITKSAIPSQATGLNLDSYFATGRVGTTTAPYLITTKAVDANGSILTVPGIYNNTGGGIGNPIKTHDGYDGTTVVKNWTVAGGIDGAIDDVFSTLATGPSTNNSFSTTSGALAIASSLVGDAGNRIMIGQFTTLGFLSYSFNLQIRNITTLEVQQWVADTPQSGQFQHTGLSRFPNAGNPTVTLTSPAATLSIIPGTTSVTAVATASDVAPGTVSQVEFFVGATSVGVGTEGPAGTYTRVFTPAVQGMLTAVATDNQGASTTSTPAIKLNAVPTNAVANAPTTVTVGSTVNFSATASDVDGTIASFEYFVDAVSIGIDNTPATPFSTNAIGGLGVHNLTVRATDNDGGVSALSAQDPYTVSANAAPTAILTATPASVNAGQTVTLTTSATDSDGTVTSVQYFDGVTLITGTVGAAPNYSLVWTPSAGSHSVTSVATDNLGAQGTSAPVTVNVNALPTITSITTDLAAYVVGQPIVVTVVPADADGSTFSVAITYNGVTITDATGPTYSATFSAVNAVNTVSVVVTDGSGATVSGSNSSFVVTKGTKYEIVELREVCNNENICVPIGAIDDVEEVIGYDLDLAYDETKVIPTGVIRKYGDLVDSVSWVETSFSIKNTPTTTGRMLIAVYFNTRAPQTARFEGVSGDRLICVEFTKKPAFAANDTADFSVTTLQESYISGPEIEEVAPGGFITYKQDTFQSQLVFWADHSPIAYTAGTNLITDIYGANGSCVRRTTGPNAAAVHPNANGEFTYILSNDGLNLNIEREIASTTDVQPVINGFDALSVRKVILEDLSFIPTIHQMIAMDVNMDGVISAGDASQINQRSIFKINEFRQEWNYNNDGTKIPGKGNSHDWLFIEESTTLNNLTGAYSISAIYPKWDFAGYNKDHVPVLDSCVTTPVSDWTRCAVIGTEVYEGILLGDANGNWKNQAASTTLRSNDVVSLDLSNATLENNSLVVPVMVNASNDVYSVDFALQFNGNVNFVTTASEIQNQAYFNTDDNTLRFTSNSLTALNTNLPVAYVTFDINGDVTERDFTAVAGYINGDVVKFDVLGSPLSTDDKFIRSVVSPNPTNGYVNITVASPVNAEVIDITGRKVMDFGKLNTGVNHFDVSNLISGVYSVKLSSNSNTEIIRLFLLK